MSIDFTILEGGYLRDLQTQPQAIADTVAGLRSLPVLERRAPAFDRIVLTGIGASLYGLYPLQLRLMRAGYTAFMVETGELIHSQDALLMGGTLVVAVSQSGRSVEMVQLLDLIRARDSRPFVVGVTNTNESPLAQRADVVVPLHAGLECSVSCKTYLATLVALEWVGGALCGEELIGIIEELHQAGPMVKDYLADWRSHVAQLSAEFAQLRHLFLTGRGASLAAVGTGALILKEASRFHAEGMSSPSFRHGPLEMVNPGLFSIIFAGVPATAALNVSLALDIRAAGGRAAIVSETVPAGALRLPAGPARLLPVFEILPVQMLTLALAALAGREPGRFERATKITVVA